MKLTNYMRDAFIRAVMGDVPRIDYEAQIDKTFRDAAHALLPAKVKALLKDKDCEQYVNFEFHSVKRMFSNKSVPAPRTHSDFKLPADVVETLDALIAKGKEQDEHRQGLERKVRGVAYAVTTRKALADALPEFERYLPADEAKAIRSLPVIANVVTDFIKAGWPKGGKKAGASLAA